MNTNALTKLVIAALEDVKGLDIQVIDVTTLTSVTDHIVIATGTSSRHVKALADSVLDKAREAGVRPLSAQGLEQGEWALVDLNGVICHTMQATSRAHYQLEKLWDLGQARPILDEPKKAKAKAKKKTAAKKPAAKKAAASKAAPKKAGAKKVTSKPARKTAAGKKPAARKTAAVKAAPKKKTAVRSALKKPAPARKPAAKKAPARKPLAKARRR